MAAWPCNTPKMSLKFQEELSSESADARDGAVSAPPAFPWFSLILILSYTAVFAAQMFTDLERSIVLAGENKDAILKGHELWRVLTGSSVHGGFIHWAMNSYAFYSFGRTFEMLTNRWNVFIVFFASTLGGSILSLVVNPHGISVGASGGIVGLVGYLAVYSFKRRDFITPEFRRSLIFNIGFVLFYGFVLVRAVDNFAHIGGLVTGAAYALFQVPASKYEDPRIASPTIEMAGLISLGVYIVTCLFALLVILQVV